jgi:hypothetical protein
MTEDPVRREGHPTRRDDVVIDPDAQMARNRWFNISLALLAVVGVLSLLDGLLGSRGSAARIYRTAVGTFELATATCLLLHCRRLRRRHPE